jgi:mannose-6-phosphate isomerase
VGCFAPLYLNHMVLEPGECCFYGTGELHAYLSGECVECVGCSNNTIRAGLTPKFIDRQALISVLNYRMAPPSYYGNYKGITIIAEKKKEKQKKEKRKRIFIV